MKCPYCQEELPEDHGDICDFCGKELNFDEAPANEEKGIEGISQNASNNAATDLRQAAEREAIRRDATIINIPQSMRGFNLGARANELVSSGEKASSAFFTSNAFFDVWYAKNRFLLAGGQMLLDLKLQILDASVRNMRICLLTKVGDNSTLKRVPCDEVSAGEAFELPVSLYVENEKINGMALLTFFFMFDTNDGRKCYKMDVRSRIYARGQSVSSIVMNIQADGGSVNDLSGMGSLENTCRNGDELLERANAEPPKYSRYQIIQLRQVPANVLEYMSSYVCDMLTLEWRGIKYHLCGKADITIGRKWEINDFALVDWVHTASDRDDFNRHTSKTHAQIHWLGDAVNLIDVSTNGTMVNGVLPEAGGVGGIRLPDAATLTMGNFKLNMCIQKCGTEAGYSFCRDCRCAKVRSMTLQRKDDVPEVLMLVWQCCDMAALGVADNRGGLLVYRRNGGFFCRFPDGRIEALTPNMEFPFGGDTIKVSNYVRDKFS
ncbi:MAG: FHA domain-containing protein [Victivallales bacterium]|nr:FHA domain-containing protein [Victivallales bacterium]